MPKFQILLMVVLISCVAFISCERAQNIVAPVMPDEDTPEPAEMMKSDEMPDMTDMSDPSMTGPSVVINELMADNDNTIPDPQGDYDDYLELHNLTDSAVTLTGMYLSDKEDEPMKWAFPENTEIPANEYLIVWLDEDINDVEGLHADFKLSKSGEIVTLVDTDGIQVLDSITFGEQETDIALGRLPNGTGDFQVVAATPGAENMAQ
ncbi:lamin tail domain-containing protein [Candidatus Poribacteria bacterium]|nr:lamin tail domain-containing protein [Candidatus Poribacteria bacterium]